MSFDSLGPLLKIPPHTGGPLSQGSRIFPRQLAEITYKDALEKYGCLVPSSNWQHRVKWPHVAEHSMALGIFIWRPPRSFGKVKRAVDVLGDICQASLLHLTKAAVSFLNSFSGHIITGPEKAMRGARCNLPISNRFQWKDPCFCVGSMPAP